LQLAKGVNVFATKVSMNIITVSVHHKLEVKYEKVALLRGSILNHSFYQLDDMYSPDRLVVLTIFTSETAFHTAPFSLS
jgi:hypothetical protein